MLALVAMDRMELQRCMWPGRAYSIKLLCAS